jgi:hypothetical protein
MDCSDGQLDGVRYKAFNWPGVEALSYGGVRPGSWQTIPSEGSLYRLPLQIT